VHRVLREDFDRTLAERGVATPLAPDAIAAVLQGAAEAGIRVRMRLENVGGSVCWTPTVQRVSRNADYTELRSSFGRMHVSLLVGPSWTVHLAGADGAGPSVEGESLADGGWVRVDAADPAQLGAWRRLCRRLSEQG